MGHETIKKKGYAFFSTSTETVHLGDSSLALEDRFTNKDFQQPIKKVSRPVKRSRGKASS